MTTPHEFTVREAASWRALCDQHHASLREHPSLERWAKYFANFAVVLDLMAEQERYLDEFPGGIDAWERLRDELSAAVYTGARLFRRTYRKAP